MRRYALLILAILLFLAGCAPIPPAPAPSPPPVIYDGMLWI